jgi:hypothetical protein
MKAIGILAAILYIMGLLDSCSPTVTVQNRTSFVVRAVISNAGKSDVVSPSPGESSSVEVSEGAYGVSVIPDTEWVAYAQATRAYLNQQLANSDTLTGPQLLEVIRRLKDVASRIQQFEQTGGKAAGCRGSVSGDGGGVVDVSVGANGALVVSCK